MNARLIGMVLLSCTSFACQSNVNQQTFQTVQKPQDALAYLSEVKAIIKRNVVLPANIEGNPASRYTIQLRPTGEVVQVAVIESSGNPALDAAVITAIKQSSPLPSPRPIVPYIHISYKPY